MGDDEKHGSERNDGKHDGEILRPRGDYQTLLSYQKAEVVYDLTFRFAHKYLSKGDRTVDQMIQSARSGKQNIAEGSKAALTSKETEIKLTNVARASLGDTSAASDREHCDLSDPSDELFARPADQDTGKRVSRTRPPARADVRSASAASPQSPPAFVNAPNRPSTNLTPNPIIPIHPILPLTPIGCSLPFRRQKNPAVTLGFEKHQ
jgi:hypothetical protein